MFNMPPGFIGATASGGDPFFANVISLLHFDGTNGGTVFTDQIGTAWTATSATTSSTQVKFGTASGSFASGYIQAANSSAFNFTGQFTFECWVYLTSSVTSGTPRNIFQVGGGSNHGGASFGIVNNACRLSAPFVANLYQGTTNIIPLNQWVHIAVTRDASNVVRSFINGVADTVTSTNATAMTPASLTGSYMSIGGGQTDAQVLSLPGFIDDLRITNNVCRYTSNFTPPTAPFPNH